MFDPSNMLRKTAKIEPLNDLLVKDPFYIVVISTVNLNQDAWKKLNK